MKRAAMLLLLIGLLLLFDAALTALEPAGLATPSSARLVPNVIYMGAFYHGVTARVEGVAPEGASVLVVIRGENSRETLNKKGRVGPIWVNTGKVSISEAPSLFLSFSEAPLEEMLSRETIENEKLSEEAIGKKLDIEPAAMDQPLIRAHFLKMKTEEDVYQTHVGAIRMGAWGPEGRPFSLEFRWPQRAAPGLYEARVYQCREGRIIAQSALPLRVRKVGLPAWMANLAMYRASIYGAMAVFAALFAGLGIDFVTMRLRKAAH